LFYYSTFMCCMKNIIDNHCIHAWEMNETVFLLIAEVAWKLVFKPPIGR